MACWSGLQVADEASFGEAALGSEGMMWPCVYHDHSKNFDGGWMGFAKVDCFFCFLSFVSFFPGADLDVILRTVALVMGWVVRRMGCVRRMSACSSAFPIR